MLDRLDSNSIDESAMDATSIYARGSFSWNYGWQHIKGESPEERAERVYWYLYNYQLDEFITRSKVKIAFLCTTTPEDSKKLREFNASSTIGSDDLTISGTDSAARFNNKLMALLCRDLRDERRRERAQRVRILPLSTRVNRSTTQEKLIEERQPIIEAELEDIELLIQGGWQVHQVFSVGPRPLHFPESLHKLLTESFESFTKKFPPTPLYQQALDEPYPSQEGIIRLFRNLEAAENSPSLWREAKMTLLHYIAQLPPARRREIVQRYEPLINRHQHWIGELLGQKTRTRKLVERLLDKIPVSPHKGTFSLNYVLSPIPGESVDEQVQRVLHYLALLLTRNEGRRIGLLFSTNWEQGERLRQVYTPQGVFSNICPKIEGADRQARFYAALTEQLGKMLLNEELEENNIAKRIHIIPLSTTRDNAPLWWGNAVTQSMLDTELEQIKKYVEEAGYDVFAWPDCHNGYRYETGFTRQRHGRVAKLKGLTCSGASYVEEKLAALERDYPCKQHYQLPPWRSANQIEAFMTQASKALCSFGRVEIEHVWKGYPHHNERETLYQRDLILSDWKLYKKTIVCLIAQASPTQRHQLIETYSNIIDMRRTPIFFKDFLIDLFGEPLRAFFETNTRKTVNALLAQTEMLSEQAPQSSGMSLSL